MAYNVDNLPTIEIGRQGENLARVVEIDVSSMLAQWPNATFAILVKRKGDAEPFFSVCSRSGNLVRWPITRAETQNAGKGQMELRCTSGDVLAKSLVAAINVTASISGDAGEAPEPSQGWVDDVLQAADKVEALKAELIKVRDDANAAAKAANDAAAAAKTAITQMETKTAGAIDELNAAFDALGLTVDSGLLCAKY